MLKRKPIAIGTGNTDIFECPASLEAAGKLMFGNTTGSSVDVTIKFYDASLNATITTAIVTIGAKTIYAYPIPAALEQGDKLIALASTGAAVTADFLIDQSSPAGALKAPTPQGAYSAGTTYATNDWVSYNGSSYVSRVDSNVGNTPSSSPTQWQVMANKGGDGAPGSNGTGTANGTGSGSVADRIVTFLDTGGNNLKDSGVGIATVNVAASGFANDNRLLRSDGTGRGTQASGVTLDDANNVSGFGTGSFSGKVTAGADGTNALDLVTKQQLDLMMPLLGGSFGGAVSLYADAVSSMQPVSLQQLNAAVLGSGKRARVRVATTVNITIATALNNGDTLDGITLANGDQVLVKNQTAPAENGVYIVGATPVRAPEYDSWPEFPGSLIAVEEGSTNDNTLWMCIVNEGGTLDTTAIAFTQLGTTPYTAGAGLTLTGFAFSLNLSNANVWAAAQTFLNSSGVKIQDTDASHTLGLILGSNLTGNRTLTITPGDASRSISLGGDLSFAGAVSLAGSHSWTGAYTFAAVLTGNTSITFPTSGTLLSDSSTATLTNKRITKRVHSQTTTSTLTADFDSYDAELLTAQAGALAVGAPSGTPTDMQPFWYRFKDNGTARAISWNSAIVGIAVTLPTSTVVGKTVYAAGVYNSAASKYHVLAVGQE